MVAIGLGGLRSSLRKALESSYFVDRRLARDFDRAMRRGKNEMARDVLLFNRGTRDRLNPKLEYALYSDDDIVTHPITSGSSEYVDPGRVPRGMDKPWMHHTHPMYDFLEPDQGSPISSGDLEWTIARPHLRGVFAHESTGGGSYAGLGKRVRHRKMGEAFKAAELAAYRENERAFPTDLAGQYATIPLAQGLKRLGILSEYGYRPSTPEVADALMRNRGGMRRVERAAERAGHPIIYGLPYPFTYGRILAGAGMGASALGGAESLRRALSSRMSAENE